MAVNQISLTVAVNQNVGTSLFFLLNSDQIVNIKMFGYFPGTILPVLR